MYTDSTSGKLRFMTISEGVASVEFYVATKRSTVHNL